MINSRPEIDAPRRPEQVLRGDSTLQERHRRRHPGVREEDRGGQKTELDRTGEGYGRYKTENIWTKAIVHAATIIPSSNH